MAGYGKKSMAECGTLAMSPKEVRWVLDGVSKAALAHAFAQTVAALEGRADDGITMEDLQNHLRPILEIRGDRVPREIR